MAFAPRVLILIIPVVLFLFLTGAVNNSSQPLGELQPGLNQALVQLHRAEAAGAKTDEISPLLVLLNRAVELNQEALQLTRPEDAQRKTQLLTQVNEILASVQTQATQLESVASQRTFVNRVVAYVSGGIAALLGTLAYAYGTSLWRKYRIRRIFQMRIVRK